MKRYEKIQKMNGYEMAKYLKVFLAIDDEICKECRFRVNGECPLPSTDEGECFIPEENNAIEWLYAEVDAVEERETDWDEIKPLIDKGIIELAEVNNE